MMPTHLIQLAAGHARADGRIGGDGGGGGGVGIDAEIDVPQRAQLGLEEDVLARAVAPGSYGRCRRYSPRSGTPYFSSQAIISSAEMGSAP